jgi:hypothetical protein
MPGDLGGREMSRDYYHPWWLYLLRELRRDLAALINFRKPTTKGTQWE